MTSVTPAGSRLSALTTVAVLLLGGLLPLPGSAGGSDPVERPRSSYGHTKAADGKLRSGCRNYRYRYRVTPPSDDWSLETFLRDPDGQTLSSGVFLSDYDAAKRTARFRFCRYSTRPGVFKIRAKLSWWTDADEQHEIWLETSRFRLRKR